MHPYVLTAVAAVAVVAWFFRRPPPSARRLRIPPPSKRDTICSAELRLLLYRNSQPKQGARP